MSIDARLVHAGFDPATELTDFTATAVGVGAVVSFTGVARQASKAGREIIGLFLDHHPILTQKSLIDAAKATKARFDVGAVRVIHRSGAVAPGEPIVFVAAASPHRRAAFDAVDYLMDRLKTDAVFWKREDAVDGSRWVEPTAADRKARARWED